ncbi:RagB/SusD family nutrient uptake outer membrane protein [Flammeovirga yaeyamensis]|uniref:RagB/SusD family nutrient uptake outer membrane protein n=1 Tax=Flammeovirga yaeyamensis TaxID=367791 RepID=A0AAX1N6W7_9BACT|nr:RagB/SusD family nutrient uptake outer membrane protein [Flammeovirga yaeyamensis]MBB3697810.1 hypothetical protein [Flammeovirga yaeyamensis]NMF35834.1 RagB/SusD family nutrient uptake outer membrane protein [Flammeovirga yaeyamensis]QWG03214.1 RagB/SusD family nutrient uptake outer membrane protein [Flammeovirga yaeyamensis]
MKRYIKKLSIIITLLSATSCSLVLDKEPLDIISDDQVWNDPNLIRANLVQLYHQAPTRRIFSWGYPWGGVWTDGVAEPADEPGSYCVISDEAVSGYSWADSRRINKSGYQRNDTYMKYWDYESIRGCNEFIEKIETGNISDDDKATLKAEARFIRAFIYFEKVKRYGGVPIITKAQTLDDPQEELYPARNTEQEVYDFIISECDELADLLPEAADQELGRANKYVALSLLSRAALYAGSIAKYGTVQLNGILGISASPDDYYRASLEASNKIITEGPYALFNAYEDKAENYQMLFIDPNHSEVIFSRDFTGIGKGHSYDYFNVVGGYGSGWGNYMQPTLELIDAYDMIDGSDGKIDWENVTGDLASVLANKDPRLHGTVVFDGNPYGDSQVDNYVIEADDGNGYELMYHKSNEINTWIVDGEEIALQNVGKNAYPITFDGGKSGFYMKKFVSMHDLRVPQQQSSTNWIEFRLAEILLNRAEAAVELGQNDIGLQAVNQIRERAGIAKLTSIDINEVRHERQIEMAFETHRMWDMRRWRIADQVMNNVFHGVTVVRRMPDNEYRYIKHSCDTREEGFDSFVPRYFNPDRNYYYPLGEEIVNNNPRILENPNY